MNKLMMTVVCVAIAFAGSAWANVQKVGNYTYTYDLAEYNGTMGACITKVEPKPSGELALPSELGTYPVRHIGREALANCTGLTSVTLPNSLYMIGAYSFSNCTSLASITIPDNVWPFDGQPFKNCSNLAKVDMPSHLDGKVTKDNSFSGCRWNLTLYFREKMMYDDFFTLYYWEPGTTDGAGTAWIGFGETPAISHPAMAQEVVIPSEIHGRPVRRIDDNAFKGCSGMYFISIPEGVTAIGANAFKGCTSLEAVEYLGDCPSAPSGVYSDTPDTLTSFVPHGIYSWADALATGTWRERRVSLMPDEWDPDDDFADDGTFITPTSEAQFHGTHTLSSTDQCDYFRIYMTAGRQYLLESIGDYDVDGELYSKPSVDKYKLEACDDDHGSGSNFSIEYTPSVTQMYYLRIIVAPTVGGGEAASYNLQYSYVEPTTCTVTFNANSGTVSPATRKVESGAKIGTLPVPTLAGYDFVGWFTAKSGGTQITANTVVTKDVTYYAHWKAKTYTVSFNAISASATLSTKKKTVRYGGTYGALPAPELDGYAFIGWFTERSGGTKVTDTTKVTSTSDHTLFARWKRVATTCTVTFNANSGTVSPATRKVESGAKLGTLPVPTLAGYEFVGWFTAKSSGTQITVNTVVTKDVTYYAHWKAKTYTVSFNAISASATLTTKKKTVRYGGTYGALPVPALDGYAFLGWFTERSGGTQVTDTTKVTRTSDHTLCAHWKRTAK